MDKIGIVGYEKNNKQLWKLYEEERNKLSRLPDADADFEALEKATIRNYMKHIDYTNNL